MTRMTTNNRRPVLLIVALLAVLAAPAAAEKPLHPKAPYALIFGTVFTQDGRAAAGVKVKIRRAKKKKAGWEFISDRRGEFALRVPAGKASYVIWLDLKDRQLAEKTAVTVNIENDERQDITLHLIQ